MGLPATLAKASSERRHGWTVLFTVLGLFAAECAAPAAWTLEEWRGLGDLPAGAVAWERKAVDGKRVITLKGVTFNSSRCVFEVADNPPPPRKPLARVLEETGAVAGANGSYFHQDFTALGLVVSRGKLLNRLEKAKLLSGVLAVRSGRMEMVRSSRFRAGPDVQDAIQAGPWLVENSAPVAGLNTERNARRTVVATDGAGRWALVVTSPATLKEISQVLALKNLAGSWTVFGALNLDGGSSTALLVRAEGKTLIDAPSWGPVRNYLAIVPRRR